VGGRTTGGGGLFAHSLNRRRRRRRGGGAGWRRDWGRRWVEEGLGAPLAWRRSCSHGSLDRPVKVPSPAETPLPPPPLSLWIDYEIPLVLFIDLHVY
jgi:hypothetical protein